MSSVESPNAESPSFDSPSAESHCDVEQLADTGLLDRAIGLSVLSIDGKWKVTAPGLQQGWNASILDDPRVSTLLVELDYPQRYGSLRDIAARMLNTTAGDAARCIDSLVECGLLSVVGDEGARRSEALTHWRKSGWEAPFDFHLANIINGKKDYSRSQTWQDDCRMMERFVAEDPVPAHYKDYDSPVIALSNERIQPAEPADLFGAGRQFDNAVPPTLPFATFSRLCFLCFGQTGTKELAVTGQHIAKTSPSGGARHPTEVYPIVQNVEGVSPGVYHYSTRQHALEQLELGDMRDAIIRRVVAIRDRLTFEPSCSFLMSSIFERSMHRYRDSRSYRVMHFDIGHLCQTAAFLCRSLQRPYYVGYSVDDVKCDQLVGLDGLTEAVMAHVTIG